MDTGNRSCDAAEHSQGQEDDLRMGNLCHEARLEMLGVLTWGGEGSKGDLRAPCRP